MTGRPMVLVPFDRREAITLKQAAAIAGRSETTVRGWCASYHIGRRVVGGPWMVSRVALAMLLDGDRRALEAYLSGDRSGPLMTPYMDRLGAAASAGIGAMSECLARRKIDFQLDGSAD